MARSKKFFSTPRKRTAKMFGLSAGIATKMMMGQTRRWFQSEEERREAEEALMADIGKLMAETLGEMKGALMKVGQVASQLQDILPENILIALKALQKDAPPMPFNVIQEQIYNEFGESIKVLFKRFDKQPFAAASIGQVHKATLHSGDKVVVKVQYPGVKESCESDLKNLKRILKMFGLLKIPESALNDIFAEIQENLLEELDYKQEASHLKEFFEFYGQQEDVVIPAVIDALSGDSVLTMSFEKGDSIERVIQLKAYSQKRKDKLGKKLIDMFTEQFYEFKTIHCDPNPANYAFRKDGTVVLYDFGSVKRMNDDVIDAYRRLINVIRESDYAAVDSILMELGVRQPGTESPGESYYREWIESAFEPFNGELFDFGKSTIHTEFKDKDLFSAWQQIDKFQPAANMVYLNRTLSGLYLNLVKLGARAAFPIR